MLNFTYPSGRQTRAIVQRDEVILEDGWYLEIIRNNEGQLSGLEVINGRVDGIVLTKQVEE